MNVRHSLLLLLLTLGTTSLLHAQGVIPQRFSYQGIARGDDGLPLPNSPLIVKLSIHDGSVIGNIVYQEEHDVSTNPFGLFTLQVGGGSASIGTFSQINWTSNLKYLRVEIDFGGEDGYVLLGTTQLLSVPYALAAGTPTDMSLNDLIDVTSDDDPPTGSALIWNGTTWEAGTSGSAGSLVLDATLTGEATSSSPLRIARQGATFGQVLVWDGTTWTPGDDEGENLSAGPGIEILNKEIRHGAHTGDVSGTVQLTVTGLLGRPLVNFAPTTGQVLKFVEGQGWLPSTDNSQVYFPGNGIVITGNTLSSDLWTENGANIYRVNGNVGIGTGSPLQQLQISKNFQLGGAFMPGGQAGVVGQILVSNGVNTPPLWKYPSEVVANSSWSLTGNANTSVGINFLGTTDAQPLLFKTNGSERMRILSDGNVGIGETSPGTALEVGNGDVYINDIGNGVIVKSPNGNCWRITVDNAGVLTTAQVTCP